MAVIGGFRSDMSKTRKTDGNFGNVFAGVLFSKVAYQRKRWYFPRTCFVNMAESSSSAAWSKSLKNISHFDSSFIEEWQEKDGKVPKKVISRGYNNFCEGKF